MAWGILTLASDYNFPLFLVYPVDMPVFFFLGGVGVDACMSVYV